MAGAARKIPFFVLTLTRSGSTWLLTLLNGQDHVKAYEELFLPREVSARYAWVADGSPERFFTRRHALGGPRPMQLWRYLDELEESAGDQDTAGFKLMLGQFRGVPELLPILAMRRYRMIALVRDNLFEGAVSRVLLDMTGDAQSRKDAPQDRRVTIAPEAIVTEMKRRRLGLRLLRAIQRVWPAPSLVLRYEDILAEQGESLGRALRIIGSDRDPRVVTSPLKRRIQAPYSELIVNYDDVCAAVSAAGLTGSLPVAP